VDDFVEVGRVIGAVLTADDFDARRAEFSERVEAVADRYPLYAQLGAGAAAAPAAV
jgi:hypothetical protein